MADFELLAQRLLSEIRDLLPRWLPGGRLIGHEWSCGSLAGEQGDSLKVNINTGRWADFAGNERGGDLISLYAAIKKISQIDALRQLSEDISWTAPVPAAKPVLPPEVDLIPPPDTAPAPDMVHREYGAPSLSWCYRDGVGHPLFYIARYDTQSGKQIVPWSWLSSGRWIAKGWPAPRPLYGLDHLKASDLPVLIVEGEKAVEAARALCAGYYTVITWPNGGKAVQRANWEPLYGRRVLIWPDADSAGYQAAAAIASLLLDHSPEVKILRPDTSETFIPPDGWDAADALAAGWSWDQFKDWAKPIAEIIARGVKTKRDPDVPLVAVQINTEETTTGQLSESQWAMIERLGLACTNGGVPICNVSNVTRILDNVPEYAKMVWFDEFHQRYFTTWRTSKTREWTDIDDLNLTHDFQASLGLHRMSDETVSKAIRIYAHQNLKNEPRDWLSSLEWDGTSRIADFLTACMGAEDSPYTQSASKNFWIGMVARIFRPGCQVDNMLVFEGAQGIGKSRALRAIGGTWYTSAKESISRNDFFMALHGKLLIEIGELDSFGKAEITRIKQVIADPTDRYRAPYERHTQDHPRMSIFVATTNEDNYLRDATGGRRFWPIRCTDINIDFITHHRAQFFAEAVHRFRASETWYEMPYEATKQVQESRRQSDEWEHIINGFLNLPTMIPIEKITISQIAIECLKIEVSRIDKPVQMRVAHILRALGWERSLTTYLKGERTKFWRRPAYDTTSEVDF